MLTNCFAACTHLSSTGSQLFELQVQKIAVFTYRSPHFCFPWGRPWGNHVKCCMDEKKIRCLQIVSQHVPIYLQQFPSYSNCKCKKSHFCFSWRRPCDYHPICCMDGKTIQCLPNPSQHVPVYLQQFPRNIGTPFGTEKLEWCRYPMLKKFRRYVYSF